MLEIELFGPGELTPAMTKCGLDFIRRRFEEVWGINRYDVTEQRIDARHNVLLCRGTDLLGWLGVEPDGELSNACIEHGQDGIPLLTRMCRYTVDHVPLQHFYADTPLQRLASAISFIASGFVVSDPPRLEIIVYPERPVHLARLDLRVSGGGSKTISQREIDDQLSAIRRLRNYVEHTSDCA
jgi:hypothetical protein